MTIHKQQQRTTDSTNPAETSIDMQPRSLPTRRYTSTRWYVSNSYIGKSVHLLLGQPSYMWGLWHVSAHTSGGPMACLCTYQWGAYVMSLHIPGRPMACPCTHVRPMACLCTYLGGLWHVPAHTWCLWHVSAHTWEAYGMSLHIPVRPMACLWERTRQYVQRKSVLWPKKLHGEGNYLFGITVNPLT